MSDWTERISTAPTSEPWDLSEFKSHERIDGNDEDSTLTRMLTKARAMVEDLSGVQLMSATWVQYRDKFPCAGEPILLYRPPVSSVTSIVYEDTASASTTWAAANYEVDIRSGPARVCPIYTVAWPATEPGLNKVVTTFVTGQTVATAVSMHAFSAIEALAGFWFKNREAEGLIGNEIKDRFDSLIHALHSQYYDVC